MAALAPPVDALADRDQIAHMLQHVALLCVAGPLLARALPARRGRSLLVVALAGVGAAAVTVGWHAPLFYEAAVRHAPLHVMEHAVFLGAALAFWWTVVSPPRGEHVVAAFLAALPMMVLGVGMTLSTTRWYPVYDAPLSEQQIAGAVMWGVGGMLTVIAGTALFYAWVSAAARSDANFHANAADANGSTSSAARNVQVTGAIETPSFWA